MTTKSREQPPEWPIEALSDQAWQRVERGVFQALSAPQVPAPSRLRSKRHGIRVLAAGALSLLLAVAWLRDYPNGTVRYLTHERSQLVHAPGVELQVEPGSSLSRTGAVWTLERGAAEFRVAPRKHDPLTVEAASVRIEVVGTVFRVARQGERVRVYTREGKVRVIDAAGSQLVAAGEHWPREVATVVPGEHGPRELVTQRATATDERRPRELATVDEQLRTPTAAQTATARLMAHATMATTRADQAAIAAKPSSRRSPERQASAAPGKQKPEHATAMQRQRFEQAAALEARDPQRALWIYRGLSEESGAWASNALFALARLELERHMSAQAARDLRRYIQRYPRGLNVSDAHALLSKLRQDRRALHGP